MKTGLFESVEELMIKVRAARPHSIIEHEGKQCFFIEDVELDDVQRAKAITFTFLGALFGKLSDTNPENNITIPFSTDHPKRGYTIPVEFQSRMDETIETLGQIKERTFSAWEREKTRGVFTRELGQSENALEFTRGLDLLFRFHFGKNLLHEEFAERVSSKIDENGMHTIRISEALLRLIASVERMKLERGGRQLH